MLKEKIVYVCCGPRESLLLSTMEERWKKEIPEFLVRSLMSV